MSLHPSTTHSQSPTTIPEADIPSVNDLVTANHILYKHNILDGFGHVSVRSTASPDTFYQTSIPSALITSPSNFTIYSTNDGTPIDPTVKVSPYSEHYIHATFYNQYPDVQCVIHSHARETLPFGICNDQTTTTTTNNDTNTSDGSTTSNTTHLRAVIHTAGFLGPNVPIWDASQAYSDLNLTQRDHPHNLLVNTFALGTHLAQAASIPPPLTTTPDTDDKQTHKRVILQRGHGFSATGSSIPEAVYNAIYTVENAVVLTRALELDRQGSGQSHSQIKSLSEEEVQACSVMNLGSIGKVWPLWVREVERDPFWD